VLEHNSVVQGNAAQIENTRLHWRLYAHGLIANIQ